MKKLRFWKNIKTNIAAVVVGIISMTAFNATSAHAYSVDAGDLILRPVFGPSINVARIGVATKESPPAGMLVGADVDFALDSHWSVTGLVHPVFSPDFLDLGFGGGGKFRLAGFVPPIIPYVSATTTLAIGIPFRPAEPHVNVGVRAAVGAEYFLLRRLAIGLEAALEGSVAFAPVVQPEMSSEVLIGLTWRL